ncbi:MAG: tRNA dimethylallyltransferase [Chloroflexota bacterium]|nr:tRNA dimethylallyltransferase [Chloroflexota bacterium]
MRYPVEKPVVLLVGPTAVGKTALSLQVAQALQAEIISADSRLFYRGMDIGTAKPTPAERGDIPHHLIDVADPDETWSLALFQRRAKALIADIQSRGKLPLVVGGTGQYVRAITEGWQVPAQKPDTRMRDALEGWADEIGGQGLHQRLALLDPAAADKIDYRNQRRTVRALEVIFNTGRRFSEQRTKGSLPYQFKLIGLKRERPELYARVDARIDQMLADGFEAEVRALLARGYPPDTPSLSAIGYCEMIATVQGESSLEEAVMLIKRRTRQFVRRQANWFKESDARIRWFDAAQVQPQDIVGYVMEREGWQDGQDEQSE